jgi:hypothetical protein
MRIALAAAVFLLSGEIALADCNRPKLIEFGPGANAVALSSGPPTETVDCYQVVGRAGQEMSVTLDGAEHDARLALYAPGWQASCDSSDDCDVSGDLMSEENETDWSDQLTASGAYLIVIDNAKSDAEYRLTVELR